MKLIPFNLEAALAGAEVRTRFGKKVTGLRLGGAGPYPVHAFCEGDEFSVTIKGEWAPGNEDGLDLFMVDTTMKTPQPYIRHVTAIRFLPDGSNADAINLVFDGNCQINSDPAQFILTPYGIILPGEWMVKKTDGWHFLTDVDFQRRYKPEPSCRWKEDEDGNWDTDCKKTYAFEYRPGNDFCHNCGGRVTFEPWKESEE